MDDNKIKELFKKDDSIPKKPTNEWANIVSHIEKDNRGFWKPWMSYATVVLLFVVGTTAIKNQNQNYLNSAEDELIAEFLFSDDYFEEEAPLYAWAD